MDGALRAKFLQEVMELLSKDFGGKTDNEDQLDGGKDDAMENVDGSVLGKPGAKVEMLALDAKPKIGLDAGDDSGLADKLKGMC